MLVKDSHVTRTAPLSQHLTERFAWIPTRHAATWCYKLTSVKDRHVKRAGFAASASCRMRNTNVRGPDVERFKRRSDTSALHDVSQLDVSQLVLRKRGRARMLVQDSHVTGTAPLSQHMLSSRNLAAGSADEHECQSCDGNGKGRHSSQYSQVKQSRFVIERLNHQAPTGIASMAEKAEGKLPPKAANARSAKPKAAARSTKWRQVQIETKALLLAQVISINMLTAGFGFQKFSEVFKVPEVEALENLRSSI
ncbi:hypothetical protein AK812_SmicGene37744 [Symbiodinium microadriaticum]|uniref:Uncharacterized protein n=1 Tax=Symbiodinium microadriaticum TaxID=2951 RepID=A0A1Q9CFK1_SYMMI|nr:hypothetical protein AK812_SmicGene37744 [Symbiodinium microadriaticum]